MGMKYKHAHFSDAAAGTVSVDGGKNKFFKTKDSTSPSGHSLVAQIDMTHAGIVTRNYGFYMPAKMRKGATTFTKDFYKPVLVGHDEISDSTPVGRVIESNYVDTTGEYVMSDSYLKRIYNWMDEREDKKDATIDFVNYIITNYDSKDNYRGLGHIRGTLSITDEEAIQAVLDKRYLTVSTSMISDSARCSVCGTDWVEEGMCEHSRGQVYDDQVCVLIPGSMRYEHVGIVNSPADPHAHTFTIVDHQGADVVDDSTNKDNKYEVKDAFEIAANLFAYKDSSLVSLSSKEDINLIEVKDNIQKMESAMSKKSKTKMNDELLQRVKDSMGVTVRVYRYDEEGKDDMEVSVSQYVKAMEEKSLQKLVKQVSEMMTDSEEVTDQHIQDAIEKKTDELFSAIIKGEEKDEELVKAFQEVTKTEDSEGEKNTKEEGEEGTSSNDSEEVVEISAVFESETELTDEEKEAKALDSVKKVHEEELGKKDEKALVKALISKHSKDAVAELNYSTDSVNDLVKRYFELKDAKSLGDMTAEEILEAMNEVLGDKALDEERLKELKTSDYCGMKGAFPVVDADHYHAAKKVLGNIRAADSVKKRILDAIEKKAEKLELDIENFDTQEDTCNNSDVSNEELLKAYEDAKAKLEENGIEVPGITIENDDNKSDNEELKEKDQEISILEAQLDAANEELDETRTILDGYQAKLVENLAVKAVDKKIAAGFQIEDREIEIKELKERSLDSLNDLITDLEKNEKKTDEKINDGVANDPAGSVDDPTLQNNNNETVGKRKQQNSDKEEQRYEIYDLYQQKLTRYGKKAADRWLNFVQRKDGLKPSID